MADKPAWNEGDGLNFLSEDNLNQNILALFSEEWNLANALHREQLFTAFVNLAGIFVFIRHPTLLGQVGFDWGALQGMFRRFHRDAFGVRKFHTFLNGLEADGEITASAKWSIAEQLPSLGIRINTESPRKTKIAAAFSFWMSVLRPVHITGIAYSQVTREELDLFCGSLNFWISTVFLSLYGDINLGSDEDSKIRLGRIPYDLTYRNVNLSSLEMLYSSVFRPKAKS